MRVEIRPAAFDPYGELARHVQGHVAGCSGATACFIGSMRDTNGGVPVSGMTLEHYPGMTERHIGAICAQAATRWVLHDVLVLHRSGKVTPGEAIVLVATWAAHRGDAQDACRFILEDLKAKAPFWKQEQVPGGSRWVDGNTTGYARNEAEAGT